VKLSLYLLIEFSNKLLDSLDEDIYANCGLGAGPGGNLSPLNGAGGSKAVEEN
jgi:hypothetical protein